MIGLDLSLHVHVARLHMNSATSVGDLQLNVHSSVQVDVSLGKNAVY